MCSPKTHHGFSFISLVVLYTTLKGENLAFMYYLGAVEILPFLNKEALGPKLKMSRT